MKKSSVLVTIFIIVTLIYAILFITVGSMEIFGHRNNFVLFLINTLNIILTIIITIQILLKNENSYQKTIWIIIMLALPLYGIIIYLMFARDYKTKFIKQQRPMIADKRFLLYEPGLDIDLRENDIFTYAHHLSGRTVFEDDTLTSVLTNGDEFFPALIKSLKEARETICLGFYIIKNDQQSREILDILIDKARSGVKVYVIYDFFASKHFRGKILKQLKKAGAYVVPFERWTLFRFFNTINFRYHRKLTIVDGRVGFIGGLNLGNEYNHRSKKFGFWRDTHLQIEGRGVISLTNIFIKDWYFATNEWLETNFNYQKQKFNGRVMVLESGPDYDEPIIKMTYFKLINQAKKSIIIVTPYLMLEPEMTTALISASISGVEISILLPGKPDKFWVNQATKSYYEILLSYGIKIYEYRDVFVHSKILIIDQSLASIGSVNFDPRSFNTNFEATVLLNNKSVAKLIADFEADLKNSIQIDLKEWKKRSFIYKLMQGFANIFTPHL